MANQPALQRVLSLPVLVLYGLGTTVGAGIYALIGQVAGQAGMWSPISFLLAAGMASLTALSFCELSARLPRAGGEAIYIGTGLRAQWLTTTVGLSLVGIGCLSAATVTRGFAGYAGALLPLPEAVSILALLFAIGALAAWGIEESAWAAAAMTLIEVGGLLMVIGAGADHLAELPTRWRELVPPPNAEAWLSIGGASLLCFYAFLGFEDMVNVAEEVRDVQRVLPQAILITLAATVVLYLLITLVVVLAVPAEQIAASQAPLADIYHQLTGRSLIGMGLIGVLAMTNGALVQVIKASRVLYGLADQGILHAAFRRVHPRRRTPLFATGFTLATIAVLALAVPIGPLAESSSLITLAVFSLANLALCFIKLRDPAPDGVVLVPFVVPVAGFLVSGGFVLFTLGSRLPLGG
jgi:APA family basic amino acid/polyamine antiporter